MKLRRRLTLKQNEMMFAWRRKELKSQAQIARDYGFHQTAISKMENGKLPVNILIEREFQTMRKIDIPDWVFLSIVRHRLGLKLSTIARELGVATYDLGDMERGRIKDISIYENHLSRLF